MGIEGFGAQIMDLPPDYSTKSHNESDSGQQELYVALRGSGAVVVHGDDDQRLALDPEHLVAVDPEHDRTLTSGSDGLRVLCIGGAPGKPYEAPGLDHRRLERALEQQHVAPLAVELPVAEVQPDVAKAAAVQ